MVTTRRTFLQSSLIALSFPLSVPLHAGRFERHQRLHVVAEAACTETRRFMAMCSMDSNAVDVDPSRYLSSLERDLRSRQIDIVFGLTFDSNRFLAEQIALDYAFTRDYFGVHDFRRGRGFHMLDGHAGFVGSISTALDADPLSWNEALAASLPALSSPNEIVKHRLIDVPSMPRTDSAPFLVSWSLRCS